MTKSGLWNPSSAHGDQTHSKGPACTNSFPVLSSSSLFSTWSMYGLLAVPSVARYVEATCRRSRVWLLAISSSRSLCPGMSSSVQSSLHAYPGRAQWDFHNVRAVLQ